jgi:hypothetical protein
MGEAMEPFHLRMKIGAHEFEAEGDQDSVERQFATWRELIAAEPSPTASSPPPVATPNPGAAAAPVPLAAGNAGTAGLTVDATGFEKIIRRDGKRLSLSVLPPGDNRTADAALVLMIAHKAYNGLDQVGGTALLDGLTQSGYAVERVDRELARYIPDLVLRSGIRRAVRYRLNNRGLNHAITLARELMDMVP